MHEGHVHSHINQQEPVIPMRESDEHTHVLEDGTIITHSHAEHTPSHAHTHESDSKHHHSQDNPSHDDHETHIHCHHGDKHHDDCVQHTHADGTIHTHSHGGVPHEHENKKAILNRMNRAIGHMESIRAMIEADRDPSEVLVQIAAVRSAINNLGKIILEEHIDDCVMHAIDTGDKQFLEDLNDAINKFVK